MKNIFFIIVMLLQIGQVACTNSGNATVAIDTLYPLSLKVSLPSYPNKKFSAYLFGNNKLIGVVRSNNVLDASGSLTVNMMAVDAQNCATSTQALGPSSILYHLHARVDSNSDPSFVYPSGCPSDAGLLSMAGQGYATLISTSTYNAWPYYVSYVYNTTTVSFTFTNTGLGTVSRQAYCSVLDGQILNPSISVSSTLGYAQGAVSFTAGTGTATTTMKFEQGAAIAFKYACWIDANGSGTYNSGDLIADGTGSSATISNWKTVP